MEFVKLILSPYGDYIYRDNFNLKMIILAHFLITDIGFRSSSPFKEWALNDNWGDECSGNATGLEKDGNYILLTDLYDDNELPSVLKMTRQQYVQVITDWEEKVCKLIPKEVIIKHENGEFFIETKN